MHYKPLSTQKLQTFNFLIKKAATFLKHRKYILKIYSSVFSFQLLFFVLKALDIYFYIFSINLKCKKKPWLCFHQPEGSELIFHEASTICSHLFLFAPLLPGFFTTPLSFAQPQTWEKKKPALLAWTNNS